MPPRVPRLTVMATSSHYGTSAQRVLVNDINAVTTTTRKAPGNSYATENIYGPKPDRQPESEFAE